MLLISFIFNKMRFFHGFIFFYSNKMFFINHVLKFKYKTCQMKVNVNFCVIVPPTYVARLLSSFPTNF